MRTFRLIGMAFVAVLLCLNLSSCKDDDEGPSVKSLIGVWEGIEADSWSIVPGYEQDDDWWADRPDKDSQRGVDISDYRVEFNSDQFYRIYTYNSVNKSWHLGSVGKWSVSNNKITMVSYSNGKYDEENPSEFKILEHKDSKITLEYYKLAPASENYGKLTFRQIATKDEMFDTENSGNSDIDKDKNVKKEYPSKYLGKWLPDNWNDDNEGFYLRSDGTGYGWYYDYNYNEWVSGEDYDNYKWFVSDGQFFINYDDNDGYAVYDVINITTSKMKLEYTGYTYTEEDGFNDEFIDEKGVIKNLTKVD